MRLALLVFALAACSSFASAKPTWPRATPREVDGGESLAPRAAARTVAAVTKNDAEDGPSEAAEKPAAAPVVTPDPPAAAAPATPTEEELMITEEIVIEIED